MEDMKGKMNSLKSSRYRVILNNAVIGKNCLIGANSLVTEGKNIPDNSLVMGIPAKVIRELSTEEIKQMAQGSAHYVKNGQHYLEFLQKQ